MDYTGLHKKTIIHTLIVLVMLLLPATAFAAPQQQTDIKKPTRERVKNTDKKGNDKKASNDNNNKKDNKADAGKKDNKPADKAATTPSTKRTRSPPPNPLPPSPTRRTRSLPPVRKKTRKRTRSLPPSSLLRPSRFPWTRTTTASTCPNTRATSTGKW